MAAKTYWQLDREYYTVTENHDLVIRVIEHENVTVTEGARTFIDSVAKKVHEFKVNCGVLAAASIYFHKLLYDPKYKESGQTTIDLLEDSAAAVTVWFKILHGAMTESYEGTTILTVWEVLAAAHKYGVDPKLAKNWFEGWYNTYHTTHKAKAEGKTKFDFKDYQALLFPCYTFSYAIGFAAATKYLVYHAKGHVTERRPDGFLMDHLRLDSSIIQQLNAARGRLKTVLHRKLYDPIDRLLKYARCECKANALYTYEKMLANTGAWPLETSYLNQSMQEILRKLDAFTVPDTSLSRTCPDCVFDFTGIVNNGKQETRQYFHGLCIDCMNASNPKFSNADADYWNHSRNDTEWDASCRIRHGQPSWYFSFMGRRQKMIEWTQKPRGGGNRGRYEEL